MEEHFCICPICTNRHRISDIDLMRIESEREAKINRMAEELMIETGCSHLEACERIRKDLK